MAILPKYDFSIETAIKERLFENMNSALDIGDRAHSAPAPAESTKEKISLSEMSSQFLGGNFGKGSQNLNKPGTASKTAGEMSRLQGEGKPKTDGGMNKR